MLQMRVFVEQERAQEVGGLLQSVQGARHVVIVGPTFDGSKTLITAELTPAMTDHVMRRLIDAGVLSEEIDVLQSETVPTIEAGERSWLAPQNEALVWSAVVNQARTNARFSAKYAVFMAIAGIIAAFGVMTENAVLIVGAMALAPDLTPVTATSVGLVGRRWRLAGRGLLTLVDRLRIHDLRGAAHLVVPARHRSAPERLRAPHSDGAGGRQLQHDDHHHRLRGRCRRHLRLRDEGRRGGWSGNFGDHHPGRGLRWHLDRPAPDDEHNRGARYARRQRADAPARGKRRARRAARGGQAARCRGFGRRRAERPGTIEEASR